MASHAKKDTLYTVVAVSAFSTAELPMYVENRRFLSFQEGELIDVARESQSPVNTSHQWLFGMLRSADQSGWFPSTYTVRLTAFSVKIFGGNYDDRLAAENRNVLRIVSDAIAYILAGDRRRVEGIFRISASQQLLEDVQAVIECAGFVCFETLPHCDVHLVCGIIKRYLSSLPDSIVPVSLCKRFQDFFAATNKKSRRARRRGQSEDTGTSVDQVYPSMDDGDTVVLVQKWGRFMHETVPKSRFLLLRHLMNMFAAVVANEGVNQMGAVNISTIMASYVLRETPEITSDFSGIQSFSKDFLEFLLRYWEPIEQCYVNIMQLSLFDPAVPLALVQWNQLGPNTGVKCSVAFAQVESKWCLSVSPGDTVDVVRQEGDWVLASFEGRRGWIPRFAIDI